MRQLDYIEINDRKNGILGCGICCIIVILLICVSFNVGGLYVGVTNQNATCYANQNIISLSKWLILENSVAVVSAALYLLLLALVMCTDPGAACGMIFILIISGIFYIIMLIIAIVELAYQFPSCKSEVPAVCAMVIVSVIISLLFTISSSNNKNKD